MINTQTSINNIFVEFIKKLDTINNENLKKNSTDENKKDEN